MSCQDEGVANPGQNGAICATGKVCESGRCEAQGSGTGTTSGGSSTTGGTSGTSNWPIVPDQGDPTVTTPNLIFMTYSDDTNQAFFNQYGVWIADGGYLPQVAGQYGVGNGTVQFVNLGNSNTGPTPAPTGTTTNQNAFPDYLQGLLTAGTIPAYQPNNLYVLILPATWSDSTAFCESAGGYHTYFTDNNNNNDLYAIIPYCASAGTAQAAFEFEQIAVSHEVVEGTTDPLITSYQIQDQNNPWFYLGGEVGDLCASNSTSYQSANGMFNAQLIWSNQAVQAGEVPCQPWSASNTYYSIIGPATMVTGAAGTTVQVPITGWTNNGSTTEFELAVEDGDYGVSFSTSPTLTSSTLSNGQSTTVNLTIPAGTPSGESGAAWVVAFDSSGIGYGSTMVGVTVQ